VRPDGSNFGVLEATRAGRTTAYYLWPVASDWGVAYRLDKLGEVLPGEETTYHVLLDPLAEGGPRCACECRGFLRWNHCKHVEVLLGLHREGLLP
jgi:hypothetical protein